ncbi:MAG TPA: hypothetical protein VGN63_22540 [Flavisolibacter sp.]|jgi:hypothetical protein|nr:hypothetical protein [Flavisolibacter sp.]
MIIPVYSNRKKAKVRFFTAYAVSVLLLLVLFSSFLKPTARIVEKFEPLVAGKADHHSAIYQALHQRMENLDKVCVNVASNRSTENLALLLAEENAFYASIDSIRKTFVSFSSPQKEKELVALLEAFTRAAEKQTSLARGVAPSGEGNGAYSALNEQLLEKEQRIAELESQNRLLSQEVEAAKMDMQNRPTISSPVTQQTANNNGAEWKARYETMKAAHDQLKESNNEYATQVNDLKKSYKDVVDDNRRLLAQLQAARAGRN